METRERRNPWNATKEFQDGRILRKRENYLTSVFEIIIGNRRRSLAISALAVVSNAAILEKKVSIRLGGTTFSIAYRAAFNGWQILLPINRDALVLLSRKNGLHRQGGTYIYENCASLRRTSRERDLQRHSSFAYRRAITRVPRGINLIGRRDLIARKRTSRATLQPRMHDIARSLIALASRRLCVSPRDITQEALPRREQAALHRPR